MVLGAEGDWLTPTTGVCDCSRDPPHQQMVKSRHHTILITPSLNGGKTVDLQRCRGEVPQLNAKTIMLGYIDCPQKHVRPGKNIQIQLKDTAEGQKNHIQEDLVGSNNLQLDKAPSNGF